MKKLTNTPGLALLAFLAWLSWLGSPSTALGQAHSPDSSAPKELILSLGYVNVDNHFQYLKATAKTRIEGKFRLVEGVRLQFYIREQGPRFLLGAALTDEQGEAMVYIPPGARDEWLASGRQHFIVASDSGADFPVVRAEYDMTKARLELDTAAGRSVLVRLKEYREGSWIPVKGVDVRVAIRRMGGDLNISDAATYSTDSTGSISADFKRDSLPGDIHGNLILLASVDDNENYGSLTVEKTVAWGIYRPWVSGYEQRSLYARRGRSPFWLDFIAYSIICLVWATILYLVLQIKKIRKLGLVSS
jgi:hypothetical protein